MGYYTRYTVKANALVGGSIGELLDSKTIHAIETLLDDLYFNGSFSLNSQTDDTKWYEWEKDMTAVSQEFPNVLFTIEGMGEEQGDIWQCFVCNGKISKRFTPSLKFEYGDFDPLDFFEQNRTPSISEYEAAKAASEKSRKIIELYERNNK